MKKCGALGLLVMVVSVVFLETSLAATRYVSLSGGHVPPFTNWATAATNIQDAIDAASDGDTILVTNGVYATGGRVVCGSMPNRVAITKPVTVRSVNGPAVTVIRGAGPVGDSAVRCVYVGANAVLSGFTLINGATRSSGDGDYYRECSGGGAWCETSGVLSNCVLSDNSASVGGGSYGGTLNNCTLTGNLAFDGGGSYYGILNNCTLTSNSASVGGGSYGGTLNNCVMSGNSASWLGGGSYYGILNNCTLSGNSAGFGGGSYGGTLNNCIVYYNGPAATGGPNFYDSTLNYSCTTPNPSGSGNITSEPQFVNAAAGDYRLLPSSPCIDTGINQDGMSDTTDLAGNPRIINGRVDMGAYEFNGQTGPIIDSISPTNGFVMTDLSVQMQIVAHSPAGIAQVTVNGNTAQDAGNNTWSYVTPLSVGLNVFTVIVTDNSDLTVTGRVQYVRSAASAGLLGHWTFDGGNANDVSGNGNNGVIIGATLTNGVFGDAYHFDGNSRIEVGNLSFDDSGVHRQWLDSDNGAGSYRMLADVDCEDESPVWRCDF